MKLVILEILLITIKLCIIICKVIKLLFFIGLGIVTEK